MKSLALLTLSLAVFANVASSEESFKDTIILERPPQCRKYKTLLALDGGGLKGMITTMVLQTISREIKEYFLDHPKIMYGKDNLTTARIATVTDFDIDLADFFDMISGISAGSWVTTYLVSKGGQIPARQDIKARNASQAIFDLPPILKKYGHIRAGNPKGLEVFFMEFGTHIYPFPVPFEIDPRWLAFPNIKFRGWNMPLYSTEGLEWTLFQFLGDFKLSEVYTSVLIGSFDLNQRAAVQFTAFPDKEKSDKEGGKTVMKTYTNVVWTRSIAPNYDSEDTDNNRNVKSIPGLDYELRDITRASSACPPINGAKVLKPIKDLRHDFQLIDGAMVGNNPTLMSLIAMTKEFECNMSQIATISIGTGTVSGDISFVSNGGFIQWLLPILSLVIDASPEFIQSNVDFLYYSALNDTKPNQYLRIQKSADYATNEGKKLSAFMLANLVRDFRQIGVETATLYRPNIQKFVSKFIFEGEHYADCGVTPEERIPSSSPPIPTPSDITPSKETKNSPAPPEPKKKETTTSEVPRRRPKQRIRGKTDMHLPFIDAKTQSGSTAVV